MVLKVSIVSSPPCVYFPLVSKQRGAPKPDPTRKVMRKQETTSVKVKIILKKPPLILCVLYLVILSLCAWLFFIPTALRRQQDGGFFKSPHYPGYPFLMIPDLTNPYLSNGSLSPSARTVSVPVEISVLFLSFLYFISPCRDFGRA